MKRRLLVHLLKRKKDSSSTVIQLASAGSTEDPEQNWLLKAAFSLLGAVVPKV